MNQFLSTRRLLCISGTRLSFILMKQQTHQCPLGPVFMISSKIYVLRRQYAIIFLTKLKFTRKMYEYMPLNHVTAQCFWYKIIIHTDEATDSSVSSGACFYHYILKSGNVKVVCDDIGFKAQKHQGMNRFLSSRRLLCFLGQYYYKSS